jgi:hypothetical protein
MAVFALTNGYCATVAMMLAPWAVSGDDQVCMIRTEGSMSGTVGESQSLAIGGFINMYVHCQRQRASAQMTLATNCGIVLGA